jgi:hypothetical protein
VAINPTTGAGFIPNMWDNRVQYAANKRRGLTKMVDDTGSKWFGPGGTIKRPIMQVWPAALTYSGVPLTIQDTAQNIGTADISPSVYYAHGVLDERAALTGIVDMVQTYAPAIVESIYQKVDNLIATAFQSAVATVGGAVEWSEGDFLSAISTLLTNGGDKVEMGQIFGVYHTNKWDAILATGNVVSAAIRGESNSAAKTGMVEMAYGVKLFFTSQVTTSTTLRNAIFVRDALWIARKNNPKFETQRNVSGSDPGGTPIGGLTTSLACSTMVGVDFLHKSTTPQFSSDLLVEHRTTTT